MLDLQGQFTVGLRLQTITVAQGVAMQQKFPARRAALQGQ